MSSFRVDYSEREKNAVKPTTHNSKEREKGERFVIQFTSFAAADLSHFQQANNTLDVEPPYPPSVITLLHALY